MTSPARAPGYDLFKLIVAIVLLILALILMWASPPQSFVPSPLTRTSTPEPTATPIPSSTSPPATATPLPLPSPTATEAFEPTATPLLHPTATPISGATATPTPPAGPTATPTPEGTPIVTACESATSRSRLQVGGNATILRNLNFRSSPGIRDNWLQTNLPGTQVKVVAGPECVPYWTGAYLWWQIRLPDGRVGWSAEESLHGSFYFMEPR